MTALQRDEATTAKMREAHQGSSEDDAGKTESEPRNESQPLGTVQSLSSPATSCTMQSPTEKTTPTTTTLPKPHRDDSRDVNDVDDDELQTLNDNQQQQQQIHKRHHHQRQRQQPEPQQQQQRQSSSTPSPDTAPTGIVSTGTKSATTGITSAQETNGTSTKGSDTPLTGTILVQETNSTATGITSVQESNTSSSSSSTKGSNSLLTGTIMAQETISTPTGIPSIQETNPSLSGTSTLRPNSPLTGTVIVQKTNSNSTGTISAQETNSSLSGTSTKRPNLPLTSTAMAQETNSSPTGITSGHETISSPNGTSTMVSNSPLTGAVMGQETDSISPLTGTATAQGTDLATTAGAASASTSVSSEGTTSILVGFASAPGTGPASSAAKRPSSVLQLGSSPPRLFRDLEQYIEAECTYDGVETSPPPSPAVSTVHWKLSPVSPPPLPLALPGSPSSHHHHHHYPSLSPQSLPSSRSSSFSSPSSFYSPFSFSQSSSASSSTSSLIPPELYQDNNPEPPSRPKSPPVPAALGSGCVDAWRWNVADKSHEVRVCGRHFTTAFFHPNWSNGTAGVRGTRPLNQGLHYWEIRVSSRLFGTSMMFGMATRKARMHADSFVNLLGEDGNSWGVSHKGLAWHGGRSFVFCPPFPENVAVTVGMVYDSANGTLEYFKDGVSLGVAFTGLNLSGQDLYPAVCSTAAKTEMTLGVTRRSFLSLQDRCRASVVTRLLEVGRVAEVGRLPLPRVLRHYVWDEAKASLVLRPRIVSLLGRT